MRGNLRRGGLTLLSVAAITMLAAAGTSVQAAGVATDFVLPIWQGTSDSAPALGHEIDCSSSNPYGLGACALTMETVITGSNCSLELVSNPASGVTGSNAFQNTSCIAKVDGFLTLNKVGSTCVYGGGSATLEWQSGVNSTLFGQSGTFMQVLVKPTGTTTWLVTVKSVGVPVVNGHTIEFNERFVATFNRAWGSCPSPDVPNLKANLYDAAVDLSLNGRDGYLKDTVTGV
jgi:hypothetical protein